MKMRKFILANAYLLLLLSQWSFGQVVRTNPAGTEAGTAIKDMHTFARPDEARVTHVDLNLSVDFERRVLVGHAVLNVQRNPKAMKAPLILDTEKLTIRKVEVARTAGKFAAARFETGKVSKILGAPLTVQLPPSGNGFRVRITYQTSPEASALQWLTPAQTVGKKHPYLFTQSQAIHARSWIPLQDSPGVRVTYSAKIKVPKGLIAVMSAEGNPQPKSGATPAGKPQTFRFQMNQRIPSYLIALAVGDLAFRSTGPRSGVYDEPSVVDRDAKELEDVEKMMQATEKLYGPYRWGRYDVVVLPPAFPYGGMENPRLTFASPTIIAGDKSLVSVICHELAHSWSGNLVTNATWSDFWLNEGFTTYLERRIVETVYGERMARMQMALGRQILERDVAKFEPKDQVLHVDLEGRDPDDGSTELPYEKGSLFLRHIEETVGRAAFDRFLNAYFQKFAFQSITTEDFLNYFNETLGKPYPALAAKVPSEEWVYKPGVPANAPSTTSDAFGKVETEAKAWLDSQKQLADLQAKEWTTQEWLHFLKYLPKDLGKEKMSELDRRFKFTQSGNIEITLAWLLMAIRNQYQSADAKLENTLMHVGRRKIIKPLYEELAKTEEGKRRALAFYEKARASYHPILSKEVDKMLGYAPAN